MIVTNLLTFSYFPGLAFFLPVFISLFIYITLAFICAFFPFLSFSPYFLVFLPLLSFVLTLSFAFFSFYSSFVPVL